MEAAFKRVYDGRLWGTDGGGSGPGSSLEASQPVSGLISHLVLTLAITSMLDVPCGAMVWMPHVLNVIEKMRDIDGLDGRPAASVAGPPFRYVGADIVPDVITANKQRFPTLSFVHADFTKSTFPTAVGRFDLVHTRAVFYHLSSKSILAALRNIKATNSTWMLASTHNTKHNSDRKFFKMGGTQLLDEGGYRKVNLQLPPYNLPPPLFTMVDSGGGGWATGHPPQLMGLWKLSDINMPNPSA